MYSNRVMWVMRIFIFFYLGFFFLTYQAIANSPLKSLNNDCNVNTGEIIGAFIWKEVGEHCNFESFIKGLEAAKNQSEPTVSEEQFIRVMIEIEKKSWKKNAQDNLRAAENFLKSILENEHLVVVIPGKVFYEVLSASNNNFHCAELKTGIFHMVCKLLNGDIVIDTYRDQTPVTQDLNSAIDGFRLSVQTMQKGEKRRLYIHPDYAYGEWGKPGPNELLVIDVELLDFLKADSNERVSCHSYTDHVK